MIHENEKKKPKKQNKKETQLAFFSPLIFPFFALPSLPCCLAVQPIALIAEIETGWNDSPLLVEQMGHANGTHRITRCKNAIAHYFKIKGYTKNLNSIEVQI